MYGDFTEQYDPTSADSYRKKVFYFIAYADGFERR